MAEPIGAKVYNHDVVAMYNRLNRYLVEMVNSVSANVSQINIFDLGRTKSYLNSARALLGWITSQPGLDLPETTPFAYTLEAPTVIPPMDNEEVADILRLLALGRDELINSQSARLGSGLIPFDVLRFTAVLDKLGTFITTYVEVVTPVDLPESSPETAMILTGNRGI